MDWCNSGGLNPSPPDQPISRAEYAILLEQAFLILPKVRQSKGFTDLKPSHWSYRPLINAYEAVFLAEMVPIFTPIAL